jgi:hypothetical protein
MTSPVCARIYRCLDCEAVLKMTPGRANMADPIPAELWEVFESHQG